MARVKGTVVASTLYDTGTMQVLVAESNKAIMRIAGFEQPSAILCGRILGWLERTVEMSGGKKAIMNHPACAARGDAFCEYRGEWA